MGHQRNLAPAALIPAVPLFYGASNVIYAAFLCAGVLICVSTFELLFFLTKRFWIRATRELFSLLVLAIAATICSVVGETSSWWGMDRLGALFPAVVVSAFLLSVSAAGSSKEPFAARMRRWAMFTVFILTIGVARTWGGSFKMFLPGSFWVSGMLLVFLTFLNRKGSLRNE